MKVLLIGLTGSGKTTVAKKLAEKYQLNLIEVDDEVVKLNGGKWPNDENIIDKHFETTSVKVLNLDNILYVISWLTSERIKEFYDKGFIIIEMHADFGTLLERKIIRDGMTREDKKRFKENYQGYIEDLHSNEVTCMYALSLDTTQMLPEEVFIKIDEALTRRS